MHHVCSFNTEVEWFMENTPWIFFLLEGKQANPILIQ